MSRSNYQFVSADADEILSRLILEYERISKRTLNPADPDRLFLSWVANVLVQERVDQNYIGDQNLPSRAEGENLDALGEFLYNLKRPAAKAATCTVRFTISEAQPADITIPQGTRVTDSTLVWNVDEDTVIPAGQTTADAAVTCETPGDIGNGYVAGQITTLIDVGNVQYYQSCVNIDTSHGGADEATDDEYYDLMRASLAAYSTAGPSGAYEYYAKSVSTHVADAKAVLPYETLTLTLPVYTDGDSNKIAVIGGSYLIPETLEIEDGTLDTDYTVTYANGLLTIAITAGGALASKTSLSATVKNEKAGCVDIYALMDDGTVADTDTKTAIAAACSAEDVRPLTDLVTVKDASYVTYNITLTYYLPTESDKSEAEITAAVDKAVDEYVAWQCEKIGRDINPSKLISLLMTTGIKRVTVTAPTFSKLSDGSDHGVPQIAQLGTKTVTKGANEDE